jgi:hypothetical protein
MAFSLGWRRTKSEGRPAATVRQRGEHPKAEGRISREKAQDSQKPAGTKASYLVTSL